MPELNPDSVQTAARAAHERLRNFRRARLMFFRSFVGHYYDQTHGVIGDEPRNMIYTAVRQIVPSLVLNFPKHTAEAEFAAHRDYALLLSKALRWHNRVTDIRQEYRRCIVDSLMSGLGILKTGLASSGFVVGFDGADAIDPGEVYTTHTSFDRWVPDPLARRREDMAFAGDIVTIPRRDLLESGLYDNAAIERLPRAQLRSAPGRDTRVEDLARRALSNDGDWADEVEVLELWLRRENVIVTVPAPPHRAPEFLRVEDYEGPRGGPYTYLDLGPPMVDSILPPAPVGIWHDLHVLGNRVTKRTLEQADRQKDIVAYEGSASDDAEEIRDSQDGEMIRVRSTGSLAKMEFGGASRDSVAFLPTLDGWFQELAGNPAVLGGNKFDTSSGTATEVAALQGNLNITMDDMKDQVYAMAAQEGEKRAWYFHTDPLINVPNIQRQMVDTPLGPQAIDVQVALTPAQRRGDFLTFNFTVEPESMGRVDSTTRLRRLQEFMVKEMPAIANFAMVMTQLGQPVNIARLVERTARERGIEWMDEVWFDPMFQQRVQLMQALGPPPTGKAGAAQRQNGQPGTVGKVPSPVEAARSAQQAGAADAQAGLPLREL